MSACFIMLTSAVATACGGVDTGPTPVPVAIDIPTQTSSKIKSEPTATSMPLPVTTATPIPAPTATEVPTTSTPTPTSKTNALSCKDIFPEAKEVPARKYILNLENASREISEILLIGISLRVVEAYQETAQPHTGIGKCF